MVLEIDSVAVVAVVVAAVVVATTQATCTHQSPRGQSGTRLQASADEAGLSESAAWMTPGELSCKAASKSAIFTEHFCRHVQVKGLSHPHRIFMRTFEAFILRCTMFSECMYPIPFSNSINMYFQFPCTEPRRNKFSFWYHLVSEIIIRSCLSVTILARSPLTLGMKW